MAKAKSTCFFRQNCGYESAKWQGQCPACMSGTPLQRSRWRRSPAQLPVKKAAAEIRPVRLSEIQTDESQRISSGMEELDRVLGGGIVAGSLMLVGGDPGIGKSTLLLQVCHNLTGTGHKVLYVSGEESVQQIKLRAKRIGDFKDDLMLLCETNLELVRSVIEKIRPEIVVIDSIQTMYHEAVSAARAVCLR